MSILAIPSRIKMVLLYFIISCNSYHKCRNFSKANCLLRICLETALHKPYDIYLEQGFLYWDKIQTNFPLSYDFFLAMSVIFLSSLLIQMFQNSREATIIYMQLSGIPQLFSFASYAIQLYVLIQSNGNVNFAYPLLFLNVC